MYIAILPFCLERFIQSRTTPKVGGRGIFPESVFLKFGISGYTAALYGSEVQLNSDANINYVINNKP